MGEVPLENSGKIRCCAGVECDVWGLISVDRISEISRYPRNSHVTAPRPSSVAQMTSFLARGGPVPRRFSHFCTCRETQAAFIAVE